MENIISRLSRLKESKIDIFVRRKSLQESKLITISYNNIIININNIKFPAEEIKNSRKNNNIRHNMKRFEIEKILFDKNDDASNSINSKNFQLLNSDYITQEAQNSCYLNDANTFNYNINKRKADENSDYYNINTYKKNHGSLLCGKNNNFVACVSFSKNKLLSCNKSTAAKSYFSNETDKKDNLIVNSLQKSDVDISLKINKTSAEKNALGSINSQKLDKAVIVSLFNLKSNNGDSCKKINSNKQNKFHVEEAQENQLFTSYRIPELPSKVNLKENFVKGFNSLQQDKVLSNSLLHMLKQHKSILSSVESQLSNTRNRKIPQSLRNNNNNLSTIEKEQFRSITANNKEDMLDSLSKKNPSLLKNSLQNLSPENKNSINLYNQHILGSKILFPFNEAKDSNLDINTDNINSEKPKGLVISEFSEKVKKICSQSGGFTLLKLNNLNSKNQGICSPQKNIKFKILKKNDCTTNRNNIKLNLEIKNLSKNISILSYKNKVVKIK